MGEIVKGIEIPDDAYLAYAAGEGPQTVNANQIPDVPIELSTDVIVAGMRLRDTLNTAKIKQGVTTATSTKTVSDPDFLNQIFTFNTSNFSPGPALIEVADSALQLVIASIDIELIQ